MKVDRIAFLGPILVLLGIFMLIKGEIHWTTGSTFTYFWPTLFIFPVAVFFHWLYFSILQRRGVGVLVPGGVLLVVALVCQIAMLFNSWDMMWPGFLLAPAAGLFELYWFGNRNKWLLIPINILTVLAVLFFAVFSIGSLLGSLAGGQPIIAAVLVIAGCLMMFFRKSKTM
ncbi:hypothetical protein [Paenibacillus physcomitrellae]|uniref:DUF5668 domain-containing protein n=1 Tax=Paenibacillus physcomitrellae TaxID=1619311 RepID=A0ABQ1FYX9_9BACL|nr:hypothetical protein [Paenibacillus physcomitrellae]GGA33344.1 hypothetical protein GCM10010917_18130 [Paenibacillus physcomitrellae]